MKVGKKLIIAMAIISIVPSLVIAMLVNVQMQSSVRTLQIKSIESLANVVAAHIYDFCNAQEMDSRFFGQISAYRECLQAHAKGTDATDIAYWDGEVQNLFDQTTTTNDNIDGGSLIDAEGRILLSYDKAEEGKSIADTQTYQSIVKGSELCRNTVVNADGSRNINLVVPVMSKEGTLLGMLKRVVNLSNINLYINEVKIGESGYVYVVDEDATLIYHGSEKKMDLAIGEFQDRKELDDLLEQVSSDNLKEKYGIIKYDNRGVATIAAYSQIPEMGWVVLVAMDQSEMQGPVDLATRTIILASIIVGLITALACYFIVHAMLLPITDIRRRIKKTVEGDYSVICGQVGSNELRDITEGINDMAIKMQHSEVELARAKTHDTLTGIYNRIGILKEIDHRLYSAEKQAIMILDMDEFEVLNEILGQSVADSVLVEAVEKLRQLPPCICSIGRFGGDSFLLFAENWPEPEGLKGLGERIRSDIEQICFVQERPVHVTVSIGMALIDDGELDLNTYLKRCNAALYKAKNTGKNTDVVYSDDL